MLSGGKALESFALHRARSSLTALAERAPHIAHVRRGDELGTVPADTLMADSLVVVEACRRADSSRRRRDLWRGERE